MVKGLNIFRDFFKEYNKNYVLIGGAACDEYLTEAGLTFRATKDLDIIIAVEALTADFVKHFWKFIKTGKYNTQQKSSGERKYYRFFNPSNNSFPEQLELFARNPDILDLAETTHLTPIPANEDLSSFSAVLMNDDYYNLALKNSKHSNNLHHASIEALICLKAKAFLELKDRKEKGETIDSRNIKKHKNDVIRLAAIMNETSKLNLPVSIANDMKDFLNELKKSPPDYASIGKSMGIGKLNENDILKQLEVAFKEK